MTLEFKFLKTEEVKQNGTKPQPRFTLELLADGTPLPIITYEGPQSLMGLYGTINKAAGINPDLGDWQTESGTSGARKVKVILRLDGREAAGESEAESYVEAGTRAYIDALNKLIAYRQALNNIEEDPQISLF